MKRLAHVFHVWFIVTAISLAQPPRSNYDPGKSEPRASKQGFIDFTLQRLNPTDKNYGRCFDEARVLLVEETVKNGSFWSNVVSLGLAGFLFFIFLYEHRQTAEHEWTMAEVLQQYEHALTRANAQIDAATKRNAELVEALTSTRETTFVLPLPPANAQAAVLNPVAKPPENIPGATDSGTTNAGIKPARTNRNGANGGNQISLFKPEVDLILKVNSLEQQLERSQEQQKQLRRQLNQADQRLQTEQQKNRTLKGA